MKYLKTFENLENRLTTSNVKVFFRHIIDKSHDIIDKIINDSGEDLLINKSRLHKNKIEICIEYNNLTEIVDIVTININKHINTIDILLYNEDDRLPNTINNVIGFFKTEIEKINDASDKWKWMTNYEFKLTDDIMVLSEALTLENYHLYISTNKYNI